MKRSIPLTDATFSGIAHDPVYLRAKASWEAAMQRTMAKLNLKDWPFDPKRNGAFVRMDRGTSTVSPETKSAIDDMRDVLATLVPVPQDDLKPALAPVRRPPPRPTSKRSTAIGRNSK